MARPREFDEKDALEQAMVLFWSKGYRATTPNDLLKAMGISKSSFYATFGCKKDLFLRCIGHYNQAGVALMTEFLAGPDTREGLRKLMYAVVDGLDEEGRKRGCLLVNTIAEASQWDDEVREAVRLGTAELEQLFVQAVEDIRSQAGIRGAKDNVKLGRFLLNALFGLQILVKSCPDRQVLVDVIENNLAVLS